MNSFFDEHCLEYDQWYEKNKFAYLSELEAVRRALPGKGYGLEIGVGSGRFAAPLGIDVGIDPSEKMIDLARKRGVDARVAFGEDLPFENGSFDYVAIIVALCFSKDPERIIEEAKRVLKDNGKIIVGIIDKDSFLGKFYQEKESIFYEHAQFYSVEEISEMIISKGFKKIKHYQTLFDHSDKIKNIVPAIDGYGKGGFVVATGIL